MSIPRAKERLPVPVGWFFNGFRRYCVRFCRKNFHGVRLSRESASIPENGPILVVLNHPGWWDPILCAVLSLQFRDRIHFGAIDARMMQKYAFFNRLGFFGVDTTSLRGAAEFLRTGTAMLQDPRHAVWVTAQGQFSDVRVRPLNLQSGVGHLASRMKCGYVLPIAYEYVFWNERTPEALIRIGKPLSVQDFPNISGKAWLNLIETRLTETLDALNGEAQSRDLGKFTELISGRTGVGGLYDLWRRLQAWLRGQRFDPTHEGKAT